MSPYSPTYILYISKTQTQTWSLGLIGPEAAVFSPYSCKRRDEFPVQRDRHQFPRDRCNNSKQISKNQISREIAMISTCGFQYVKVDQITLSMMYIKLDNKKFQYVEIISPGRFHERFIKVYRQNNTVRVFNPFYNGYLLLVSCY